LDSGFSFFSKNPNFAACFWFDTKMNEKIQKITGLVATGKFWKDVVVMTLGMLVAAAAVYYFLVPSN